jgi:hypothetical protein
MDSAMIYLVLLLAVVTVAIVGFYAVRIYLRYRGKGVVYCPETGKPVAVEIDAAHAALTFTHGIPELRLNSCTRWPERAGCGQECVVQIELMPEQCMVRELLARWFNGKPCFFCHRKFGEINWTEHKPALYDALKQRTVEWDEIPAEQLPVLLGTYLPVCWNCHIAETFRQEHPELVVERRGQHAAHV